MCLVARFNCVTAIPIADEICCRQYHKMNMPKFEYDHSNSELIKKTGRIPWLSVQTIQKWYWCFHRSLCSFKFKKFKSEINRAKSSKPRSNLKVHKISQWLLQDTKLWSTLPLENITLNILRTMMLKCLNSVLHQKYVSTLLKSPNSQMLLLFILPSFRGRQAENYNA